MKVRLLTWNTLAEKLTPMGELVSGAKTDPGCVGRIAGVITHHNPDGRPRASCSAGDWGSPAAEMHVAARLTAVSSTPGSRPRTLQACTIARSA